MARDGIDFVVEVFIRTPDWIILPDTALPLRTLPVGQELVVLSGSPVYLAARTICKPAK